MLKHSYLFLHKIHWWPILKLNINIYSNAIPFYWLNKHSINVYDNMNMRPMGPVESPSPKEMHCAKFGWNWLSGSGEEDLNFVSEFSLFCNYLPLEKGGTLHLNKIESSLPKDALCQVWLKLAMGFWSGYF